MDIDVFPNTLEYWGPNGMVFFRNIQIRYMPIQGDTRMTIALERPGASGDAGVYADRVELQDVQPALPAPRPVRGIPRGTRLGLCRARRNAPPDRMEGRGTDSLDRRAARRAGVST